MNASSILKQIEINIAIHVTTINSFSWINLKDVPLLFFLESFDKFDILHY